MDSVFFDPPPPSSALFKTSTGTWLPAVPRIVLCAGLVRSGSTWLFNAARLLLMLAEREGAARRGEPPGAELATARVHASHGHRPEELSCAFGARCVLKIHAYSAALLERLNSSGSSLAVVT